MAFNSYKKDSAPNTAETGVAGDSSRSYLGRTMQIKGQITSEEYLVVEGKVEGSLEVSKTVTIGKNGHVDGRIAAEVVEIHGKAEGDIKAANKLKISAHGNFQGTVQSDKLAIEEGAVFKGKVNI